MTALSTHSQTALTLSTYAIYDFNLPTLPQKPTIKIIGILKMNEVC